MAREIPVGYGELAFVLEGIAAGPYVTTLGVSLLGLSPTDYVDAANAAFDAYSETLLPITASALTLSRVDLRVGLTGGSSGTVTSDRPAEVGGRSSASALLGAAPVVQKRSADLGRSGRGRSFVPAVIASSDLANDGSITQALREDVQERYETLITALATFPVGEAMSPVILHADEATPTPITGVTVASQAGIIRSRLN